MLMGFAALKLQALSRQGHDFIPTKGRKSRAARARELTQDMPNPRLALPDGAGGTQEFFLNKDGLLIHFRRWRPLAGFHPVPNSILIIVHGLGEYTSRYNTVAQMFNRLGSVVYGLDHQGHGRSEGDRLYVENFDDFVDDILQLVEIATNDHPNLVDKIFILGHSMGGLMTVKALLRAQSKFKGAILSAPALYVNPNDASPWKANLATILSSALPRLEFHSLLPFDMVVDPNVRDWYANDPLVIKTGIQVRIGGEAVKAIDEVIKHASEIELPYLILHGDNDKICPLEGSKQFHTMTSSTNKALVPIVGFRHDIFLEPLETNVIPQAVNFVKSVLEE